MTRIFQSLRFRLLLIVLLSLLPAFGMAIFNATEQRKHIEADVQEDTLELAQRLANHQLELLEGTRQLLFVLAQQPVLRQDDAGACGVYLANLKQANPRYMNILKWDLEGNLLCDASNSPLPHKMPTIAYLYKVLQARDFTILNFVTSPHTGERALSFGYPILSQQGQAQSVLFAALYLDSFGELISQAELPPGSTVTLRDRNGIVLGGYPNPENWIGKPDPKMELSPIIANLQGEGTLEMHGVDGVLRLYAYTPVFSPTPEELYLIVGVPVNVAMAVVEQSLWRNLLILGLAGLLALIAIWLGGEFLLLYPIHKMLGVTRKMSAGDMSARVDVIHEASELNELAQSFDQMAENLEKRELDYQQAQIVLQKQELDLERLLHQVITANENERLRIARELHDETSQNLTALMLGLDTAGFALEKDPIYAKQHFYRIKSIAGDLLEDTHRLVNNLRPPVLDDLGLVPAIQACAEKRIVPLGIDFHIQVDIPDKRLPQFIETALFRIIQEAFTNIARYAQASNVYVHLYYEEPVLTIEIRDDGQGFNPELLAGDTPMEGFGLRGMQERIRMLNGQFTLETAVNEGVKITVLIPIPITEGLHV